MDIPLFVATADGLVICRHNGKAWLETARGLTQHNVTSVIAREGVILAGTSNGVYRSDDLGQSWRDVNKGLTQRHIRWLAYDPEVSNAEFAGTEPAGIFVSRDGAEAWRTCPEVEALRDANDWFLPYSPEAGCVRGFAFHGRRVYAAVEVGGVLRSDDGGDTWEMAPGSSGKPTAYQTTPANAVHPDVHSIAVHPSSANLVFAPTGGGLFGSRDGGQSWSHLYSNCYCRAIWLDLQDPDHLIFGPARSVSRGGRIEESLDGGQTWQLASEGLDVPWPSHMVERLTQLGDNLFVVLSNGQLLAAPLATLAWQRILPDLNGVAAVATMDGAG